MDSIIKLDTKYSTSYEESKGTFIVSSADIGETFESKNLPSILKAIREQWKCKTPHGNTIRSKLIDFGKYTFAINTTDGPILWKVVIKYKGDNE